MAIFGNNVIRLLREKWQTPTILAEELYALLQSDTPIEITSPVQVTKKNPNLPAFSITNNAGGDTFTVRGGDVTFGGDTTIKFPDGSTIDAAGPKGGGGTVIDEVTVEVVDPPKESTATLVRKKSGTYRLDLVLALGSSGGGGFLGTIVSGSGDSYDVRFFEHGSQKPSTRSGAVRIPNLLPSVTLPAGTWIGPIVALQAPAADGAPATTVYECLVPIWM